MTSRFRALAVCDSSGIAPAKWCAPPKSSRATARGSSSSVALLSRLPEDGDGSMLSGLRARIDALEGRGHVAVVGSFREPGCEPEAPLRQALLAHSGRRRGGPVVRPLRVSGIPAAAKQRFDSAHKQNALTMRRVESLAWGRNSGACFPHRRCDCPKIRKYSELASINADLDSPAPRVASAGRRRPVSAAASGRREEDRPVSPGAAVGGITTPFTLRPFLPSANSSGHRAPWSISCGQRCTCLSFA